MARWLAAGRTRACRRQSVAPPQADALRAAVPERSCSPVRFSAAAFAGVELIAISPGVPVQEPLLQEAVARGIPLVSEIELFAWGLRQPDAPQAQADRHHRQQWQDDHHRPDRRPVPGRRPAHRRSPATSARRRWTP
jgi:hypothetical protein